MNDTNDRYRQNHAPLMPPALGGQVQAKTRKIYIGKTHDNYVIGIVLAESEQIAHAYFVGRGDIPNSMVVIDPMDENLGIMGLCTLFKTSRHKTRQLLNIWEGRDFLDETRLEDKS